jgi:hypothetical protein
VFLCSPDGRRAVQSAVEVDHKLRSRSANNNKFNTKFKKTYIRTWKNKYRKCTIHPNSLQPTAVQEYNDLTAAATLRPKSHSVLTRTNYDVTLSQATGCSKTGSKKHTMQYVLMCRTEIPIYALRRRCQQPSAF